MPTHCLSVTQGFFLLLCHKSTSQCAANCSGLACGCKCSFCFFLCLFATFSVCMFASLFFSCCLFFHPCLSPLPYLSSLINIFQGYGLVKDRLAPRELPSLCISSNCFDSPHKISSFLFNRHIFWQKTKKLTWNIYNKWVDNVERSAGLVLCAFLDNFTATVYPAFRFATCAASLLLPAW